MKTHLCILLGLVAGLVLKSDRALAEEEKPDLSALKAEEVTDDLLKSLAEKKLLHRLPFAKDERYQPAKQDADVIYFTGNGCPVSDDALKSLCSLTNLKYLYLSTSKITDQGLPELLGLKNLEQLIVDQTAVTGVGIAKLHPFPSLKRVYLAGPQITDDALNLLAEQGRLHVLFSARGDKSNPDNDEQIFEFDLNHASITDEGLLPLSKLTGLQRLLLSRTKITSQGLKHLEPLTEMRILDLSFNSVTDEGLQSLQSLKQLEFLNLHGTKVTNDGLMQLENCSNLATLYLAHSSISDDGIPQLLKLKNLEFLTLGGTKITPAGVQQLCAMEKLKTIQLGPEMLTDDAIGFLVENNLLHRIHNSQQGGFFFEPGTETKTIKALYFHQTPLTDEGLKHLQPLTELQALFFQQMTISDEGLKHLAVLTKLRYLGLYDTNVTSAGLKHLAPLAELEFLDLSDTAVDDDCLEPLQNLKKLKRLNLFNTQVTPEGLDKLRKAMPDCLVSK